VPAGSSQHIRESKCRPFLGGRSILIRAEVSRRGVLEGRIRDAAAETTQKKTYSSRRFRLGVLGVLGG